MPAAPKFKFKHLGLLPIGFFWICVWCISTVSHWLCSSGHPTADWVLQDRDTGMEQRLSGGSNPLKAGRKQNWARGAIRLVKGSTSLI